MSCNTKVTNLEAITLNKNYSYLHEEDIGGFDISVDDIAILQILQSIEELEKEDTDIGELITFYLIFLFLI